jgi:ElaA protein
MRWETLSFDALSPAVLYELLALRQLVFVVEQRCAYLDADGLDLDARHVLGRDEHGKLVACARLLSPGASYDEVSIGRIVTHPGVRGRGLGRALVRESLTRVKELFGDVPIRIGAQRYLERFYGELGFVVAGSPYDEDGIPHIPMLRAP